MVVEAVPEPVWTGPDPEPECPVFGVASFSLHRLAQGDLCTKMKANIVPITKLKVRRAVMGRFAKALPGIGGVGETLLPCN